MELSRASYMHLEPSDLCSSVCPKTDGIFCAIVDATLSVLGAVECYPIVAKHAFSVWMV